MRVYHNYLSASRSYKPGTRRTTLRTDPRYVPPREVPAAEDAPQEQERETLLQIACLRWRPQCHRSVGILRVGLHTTELQDLMRWCRALSPCSGTLVTMRFMEPGNDLNHSLKNIHFQCVIKKSIVLSHWMLGELRVNQDGVIMYKFRCRIYKIRKPYIAVFIFQNFLKCCRASHISKPIVIARYRTKTGFVATFRYGKSTLYILLEYYALWWLFYKMWETEWNVCTVFMIWSMTL